MLAAGLLAERALARGLDPSVELADMDAAVADMIRLVPMHWSGLQGQAWRRYLEARRPGQPQGAVVVLLVQAEREVTKALGANPEPLDLHLLRIRIRRRLIEVGAPEAALRRRQVMEELRTQLKRTPRALQVRAEARALGITIR
jgi:hypothetical protein